MNTGRLSLLAQQLKSEDREKYNKVIEIRSAVQSRLDYLYNEKFNTISYLRKQHSMWNLNHLKTTDKRQSLFYTVKRLDRATSMQFITKKPFQFTDDDDEELEEIIHVLPYKAVRKDAAVIRIEKHGLLTPPDSPHHQELFIPDPPLIRLHKKNQSIKGLLKRKYKLGNYQLIKSDPLLSFPVCDGLWIKAIEDTGNPKMILKLVLALPDHTTSADQRRFGFTFQKIPNYDHVKLSLVPDSLVKEALVNWIDKGVHNLPPLSKADKILREKKKIYVVYDVHLLQF
ncbi:unnamed protein product [Rhizopus stolonifer]